MSNPSTQSRPNNGKKKRARPLPAHVMARNLAIEKRRREELNEDFLNLARLVPGLAHARRLSKVLIVNESIRHLRTQRDMCVAAASDMQNLLAENSRLVAEVNGLRAQLGGCGGIASPQLPVTRPVSDAMTHLMSVKDEVYGEFPAGFGDNWAHYRTSPTVSDGISAGNRGMELSYDSASPPTQEYLGCLQQPAPNGNEMMLSGSEFTWSSLPLGCGPSNASESHSPFGDLVDEWVAAPTLYSEFSEPIIFPGEHTFSDDIPDCLVGLFGAGSTGSFTSAWTDGTKMGSDSAMGNIGTHSKEGEYSLSIQSREYIM
ncbi:hypothetical protein BJX63DRAFT_401684 [Aspergillus granulosus]|uniref:BHLH domain-containing protein n=1 Tax=Aspergillus granulosus TaxID=176169 RepID=A0ABR4H591_9EURO